MTRRKTGTRPSRRNKESDDEDVELEKLEEEEEEPSKDEGEYNSEEEEEEEEEEDIGPKVLPDRETRGRRIQTLIGEAVEQDQNFWGHETWREEKEDEEWSTEDEGHYKDVIDSDFDDTESEEEQSEATEEQRALDILEKAQKTQQRLKAYQDPRSFRPRTATGKRFPIAKQRPQKVSTPSGTLATENRPLPPPSAQPRSELETSNTLSKAKSAKADKRGRTGRRVLSQEDHLAIASITELENTKRLNAMIDHENWKKAMREQKQSSTTWSGPMELFISWSSERLIDYEEQQKIKRGIQSQTQEEPYCREMLFFVDFNNPVNSAIPGMYKRSVKVVQEKPCSVFAHKKSRYRDPATGEYYSDARAFRELRRRYQQEWSVRLESRLKSLDTKLRNILHYISVNDLIPLSKIDSSISSSLLVEERELPQASTDSFEHADLGQLSSIASDEEIRQNHPDEFVNADVEADTVAVPSITNRKRIKRHRRISEASSLPSPKRTKHERTMNNSPSIAPLGEGAPNNKSIAPIDSTNDLRKTVRKPERRNDSDLSNRSESVYIKSDDLRHQNDPNTEEANRQNLQGIRSQQQFAIRRQPLRIRSTANAFCQQSAFPSHFGPSPFFPPDPRFASTTFPFDPLTLFSLGATPNFTPYHDPAFPPYFAPIPSFQCVDPTVTNAFRHPLSSPVRPRQQNHADFTITESSASSQDVNTNKTVSSVYCYPHAAAAPNAPPGVVSNVFVSSPSIHQGIAQSSEISRMTLSPSTPGVAFLPPGVFPPPLLLGTPFPVISNPHNPPQAGVIIRPNQPPVNRS